MTDDHSHMSDSEMMPPDAPSGPLCVVFSSYSPVEAHIVSGMLEDSGIECCFGNEFIAAVESPVSNVTGGVKVLVRASDVDRAGELLREASWSEAEPPLAEN